jgi:hypothetical protein
MFKKVFSILLVISVFGTLGVCQDRPAPRARKVDPQLSRKDLLRMYQEAVSANDKLMQQYAQANGYPSGSGNGYSNAEELAKKYPREEIWKPEMGPQPQDYIRVVLDGWISQLQKAVNSPHHFYSPQYITLYATDELRAESTIFKFAVSNLTDFGPPVATEWCHIPFSPCHYNVDYKNFSEALERLKYFEKTYMARDTYCSVIDNVVYDYSGEFVNFGVRRQDTFLADETEARNNSLEVCRFSGPIIFGKCFLNYYFDSSKNSWMWETTSGGKRLGEPGNSKDATYREMLSTVACKPIPGGG